MGFVTRGGAECPCYCDPDDEIIKVCVCVCVRVCVCVCVCVITDGAVLKLISFTGNNKTLVSFYNGDLQWRENQVIQPFVLCSGIRSYNRVRQAMLQTMLLGSAS